MISEQVQSIVFLSLIGSAILWIAASLGYFRLPLRKTEGPTVTFKSVLQIFAIYFGISLLIAPLIARLVNHFQSVPTPVVSSTLFLGWVQVFSLSLLLLCLFLFCRSQDRQVMKKLWKDNSISGSRSIFFDFGLGMLSWIITFPLVSVLSEFSDLFLHHYLGIESYEQVAVRYLKMTLASPVSLMIALFTILIAAPLMEELLFRGFLQNWLKKQVGTKAAILVAALCFATFHIAPSQGWGNITLVLALFSLACFLGFLYERQGSLLAPIGLHMTFNAISTFQIIFTS
jgi:membrane protease YdiL (CAAX protease family)